MKIRGAIDTEFFQYIKLSLVSCNANLSDCATSKEIAQYRRIQRIFMPEPTVNFDMSEH